ncbi:MAG: nucleotidyltransferase domain-containing protein [Armatimonadetes bacterium]|nr:nucleotidyltransferase domain-containing protein [Armatimonadota bacterium]
MPETIDTPPVRWESLCPEVTDALLENITRRVVEAFAPVKVMLFGSYANGKPGPYSDVDLLVVMESTDPAAKRIVKVARAARVPYLPMDILVYTPEEIQERLSLGDFFIQSILQTGRVLYEKDL